jgi:hypothetical protein
MCAIQSVLRFSHLRLTANYSSTGVCSCTNVNVVSLWFTVVCIASLFATADCKNALPLYTYIYKNIIGVLRALFLCILLTLLRDYSDVSGHIFLSSVLSFSISYCSSKRTRGRSCTLAHTPPRSPCKKRALHQLTRSHTNICIRTRSYVSLNFCVCLRLSEGFGGNVA